VRIDCCSAPCASGKTHELVEEACSRVKAGQRVLFLQPTRELIDKTIRNELEARSVVPRFEVFHSGVLPNQSVAKAISDFAENGALQPCIVFATHQVLPYIRHFANKDDWCVLVDEALQVVRYEKHRVPRTHALITDHIEVAQSGAIYGRVLARGERLDDMALNRDEDEILEFLSGTSRILANRNWETFINLEQYARLLQGEGNELAFHSILKPEIFGGFGSIFMAAANFEDTAIYRLWGEQGVHFVPNEEFASRLRYSNHPNGDTLTIYYATERQWSKKLRKSQIEDGGLTVQDKLVEAAKSLYADRRFLWHANAELKDDPFGQAGHRLPSKPHGLNIYTEFNDVLFLSSLNPAPDHFHFLRTRGLEGADVRAFTYCEEVYQTVMRCSLRNPEDRSPKTVIVPDQAAAEYLQNAFPGSKVEKLDVGLNDEASTCRGRPRKHNSNKERVAAQRQKARDEKVRLLAEQLGLNAPDALEEDGCWGEEREKGSRAKKGIRILYTNFGTAPPPAGLPLIATIFSSTSSATPLGYASGEFDDFLDTLRRCQQREIGSKEEVSLFSPAIFDPTKAKGTKRGTKNIVYLRNVLMDFEKGELKPSELPNLFPGLQMVVMNTYRHVTREPRFRVVIPTTERMTPEVYKVVYQCLADKLEEAGYHVDYGENKATVSNARPSGLDWSKSLPTSLFYLPSQAERASDSFFLDFLESPRAPLNPSEWVRNSTFPLQPELPIPVEPAPASTVDRVLVESAKEIWRSSSGFPGRGNEMFFDLALTLRRAGMAPWEIESTLRAEAAYGRSPEERLRQITSIMTSLRRKPFVSSN
jgi:hypothetical protein